MSRAHSQHPSQPPPADPARKKRRALADGPAFRAALAAVDAEPTSGGGGWKLLDGPPPSGDAPKTQEGDLTQPEATWRVVSGTTEVAPAVEPPVAKAPEPVNAKQPLPVRAPTPAPGVPRPTSKMLRAVTPPAADAEPAQVTPAQATAPQTAATRVVTPPPFPARTEGGPKRVATPPPFSARTESGGQRVATPPPFPARAEAPATRPANPGGGPPPPPKRAPTPPPHLQAVKVSPGEGAVPVARTEAVTKKTEAKAAPRAAFRSHLGLAPAVRAAQQDAAAGADGAAQSQDVAAPPTGASPEPAAVAPSVPPATLEPDPDVVTSVPPEMLSEPLGAPESSFVPPPPPPSLEALAARLTPATPFAAHVVQPVGPEPVQALEPIAAPVAGAPQPAFVADADFSPVVPVRAKSRTKLLIAIAAVGIVSGVGLGLVVVRSAISKPAPATPAAAALAAPKSDATPKVEAPGAASPTPAPEAAAKAPEPEAAKAPEPAAAPAAAAAPAPAEPAAAAPQATAGSSAIPWDDLPQTTAKTCEELAQVSPGPRGFLLQQAVTNAQKALLKGDAAAAHASFCTAAQLGVPSDTVLLGLAQVLLMQGDPTAALKMVDQLLERAPTNKQAHEWRGDILIRLGRVDDAKVAWFKSAGATRESKLLVDNLVRLSDAETKLALQSGDLSRADRMLRRVIALTSGEPEHCRQLVAVLTKDGKGAAAERWRGYLSTLSG